MKKKTDSAKTAVVVSALEKKARPLFKKLPDTIKTREQFEAAAANMKLIKELGKEADREKKGLLEPLALLEARIRSLFAPFEYKRTEAEASLKTLMEGYLKTAKDKAGKIAIALDTGRIKNASTAVRKQNELTPTSNIAKVWQVVEVDATKTPAKYMVPDIAAIKADLKEGKKVAGWDWQQVEQIRI